MKYPVIVSAVVLFLSFIKPMAQAAAGNDPAPSEFMERLYSLLDSVPPPPPVTEAEVIELEEADPKTYIFINRAKAHPPVPYNLGGDGRLALTRQDNNEQIIAYYRRRDGTYNQTELAKINRLMRCRLTGKETSVSLKLLEILDAVEDRFGKRGIILLSGYRTPTLNRQLPGAARWSMHMLGWAADIRIQGYSPAKVTSCAKKLRSGGVGHYPDAAFTHLDSGHTRYWVVRARPVVKAASIATK